MGLPILMLMLLQALAPVETRVVQPRDAPVSLVGLPCGEADAQVLATLPTAKGDALESAPFTCARDCRVGIRINKGAAVDSIVVGSAAAHDRRRIVTAVTPRLALSAQRTCGGEPVVSVSIPKLDWPLQAAFYFVAEVKFQDGTTWSVDPDTFTTTALAAWLAQPKRGQ